MFYLSLFNTQVYRLIAYVTCVNLNCIQYYRLSGEVEKCAF